MRPRRTPNSNQVLFIGEADGGTEDNDLHVEHDLTDDGIQYRKSVWELSDDERLAVVGGANISLIVFGPAHPIVQMHVTTEPLGKDGLNARGS